VRLALTRQEVAPLLRLGQGARGPQLSLDGAALRARVAQKAAALSVAARNASVSVAAPAAVVDTKGDLVWTPRPAPVSVLPATAGRTVDVDAATARLRARVLTADRSGPQPLALTTVQPAITTAAAQRVRTVVGTFTTRFAPGQPRATNIRRIAQLVDGTWVAPGAEFSLNGTAGRRTRARGFVADGAIVDGALTDEVGGGVSQFATTLFNAAFFAGVPILEHKPHSFYISRYPAGRESTVYYGAIDVRFRNDTAVPLLVRTRSTASSVTVELYGDNGGRRVVSSSGPRRPRADGGFRIDVVRTTTGGDGRGGRRVFSTSYDPVPPD
jgi:vancomycin resistance protein YoaR